MKTTRTNAGLYQIAGETVLDGQSVEVRFSIWKHESIAHTWLSETTVNGRTNSVHSDYGSKKDAVAACKRSASRGYRTVPGFGVCVN
jgi:hypothetical protein